MKKMFGITVTVLTLAILGLINLPVSWFVKNRPRVVVEEFVKSHEVQKSEPVVKTTNSVTEEARVLISLGFDPVEGHKMSVK